MKNYFKKKIVCPPFLFCLLALGYSPLSYSQFERFESDSDFDDEVIERHDSDDFDEPDDFREPPPRPSAARETSPARGGRAGGGGAQVFGRGDTPRGIEVNRDGRFVNLNPETAFGPEVVKSFDFPDTNLVELTRHMQELTGINLIVEGDIRGNISIMAPSPITVGDAWKAYLTALNVNGYTLVKSGEFYKIVNARDIRYTPTKIYTGNFTPDTDNYVMRIIPLKNIDSSEVTRSFRPFMSRYGRIIDIQQTNTIIIQDTGSNINRLVRLIKFIDVPGHEETLQIIQVHHTSAQEIARLLDQILQGNQGPAPRRARPSRDGGPPGRASGQGEGISKIIAEPRTNSIIAMANASGARQLRELIAQLDVEVTRSGDGQIHVYYLNHGDAENLAETLNSLVSGSGPARSSRATRAGRAAEGGAPEEESIFRGEIRITADKSNNALVVTASPTDYMTIREIISQLDIPRDQVYVEGLMMETNVSRERGFGISVVGAYGSGNVERAGFTGGSSDLLNLITGNITSLGGLFVGGGVGRTVTRTDPSTGQSIELNSVNALLTAIATSTDTNVLATPQILALDNQGAVFEVGETVPTLERQTDPSGSTTVTTNQQTVALTLKITPQINRVTRFVRLNIDQKIEDFSTRNLPDGLRNQGVATTTRSAITTVVVRDRDTIAMGGLMRDRETYRESKVPLLGDIPVLGWLFKNTSRSIEKVNLLFFLTPRILANYQRDSSGNVKDVLNRRGHHLKEAIGADDPFASTVKGIFDKAQRQSEGPLYDPTNTDFRPSGSELEQLDELEFDVPDYSSIMQQIQSLNSGRVRQ